MSPDRTAQVLCRVWGCQKQLQLLLLEGSGKGRHQHVGRERAKKRPVPQCDSQPAVPGAQGWPYSGGLCCLQNTAKCPCSALGINLHLSHTS